MHEHILFDNTFVAVSVTEYNMTTLQRCPQRLSLLVLHLMEGEEAAAFPF